MYKLTAICPTDISDDVISVLREEPDARSVFRMTTTVDDDKKDVVTAYVQRGATDLVIEHLRKLRQWDAGELSFIELDMAVRRDLGKLDAGEEDDDGEEDTLGWEMILDLAHAEARLTWWYLTFMGVAGLIAAVGLIQDLPLLLVGAMSLSPDLAPTNAIAVALTAGALREFFKSLRTLILGLAVATTAALLLTLFLKAIGAIETASFSVEARLVAYVTVVEGYTLIVALAAGVAAMVAFVTNKAQSAVGVAISITTIPAAAYIGVALADRSLGLGGSAVGVLFINISCLIIAQIITLVIIRWWRGRKLRQQG